MDIVYTDGKNKDFIKLCELLDESLNELVGGIENRKQYCPYNQLDDINDVVILYLDNQPVASGSFKHFSSTTAEIKRVFVKKEYRGQQLSKEEIEAKAKDAGYTICCLETGAILKVSNALYKSIGYSVIENYGPYLKYARINMYGETADLTAS